jgi:hypothetical protein
MSKIRSAYAKHSKLLAGFVAGALLFSLNGASAAPGDPPSGVITITPTRILDTRLGLGAPAAPLGPGGKIDVQVTGQAGVPANATGVIANVTVTGGTAPSFVTVWPTGQPQPTASSLNVTPGQDLPNSIVVALGTGGKISIFNNGGSVHVVADVTGFLVPGGGGQATSFTRTKIDNPLLTTDRNVQQLNLPAGSWLVTGRVDGAHDGTAATTRLECSLLDAATPPNVLDHEKFRLEANPAGTSNVIFASVSLNGIATLTAPGVVGLACASTNGSQITLTTAGMTAVQVAAPTSQN